VVSQEEDKEGERPEELRTLARRVQMIASALDDREKRRLLAYADELEALAAKLEGG
jgi:hypothetical protein